MRPSKLRTLPLVLISCAIAAGAVNLRSQQKVLTFGQIFNGEEPKLTKALPNVTGWADEDHYIETKKNPGDTVAKEYSVSVRTGRETLERDMESYRSLLEPGIDPANPVSATDDRTELIYVKDNDLYYLNTGKRESKRLTKGAPEMKNPTISPDGREVAFTRKGDLYSIDIASGREYRYTHDAGEAVYSGYAAWVYYEEILGRGSRYRAFWWSPDGRFLAFYRFDESRVPLFPIYNSEGVHGSLENERYPEAGDPNPDVKIGIVRAGGDKVVWADFDEKADQYFGPVFWTPGGRLVIQWMNRAQDTLRVYYVDPLTGRKELFYGEHQSSWVSFLPAMYFLESNRGFIIRTDKDGWSHLYLHASDGTLKNRITDGRWSVVEVASVDGENEVVYFTAKKEASTNTDLYKAGFDGRSIKRLTFGSYTHTVTVSPHSKHFITTYSSIGEPPGMAVYDNNGSLVRKLGDSRTAEFDNYKMGRTELFRVTTPDGYALPVSWTLPTDFDSLKKYPVLISVYGGPGSASVSNSWGGLRPQWLALEGMVQISMDHRGSGHFGKEGAALMYRNLGKWEMNDYIEVVKWLRQRPWVDPARICITGGSYGGYVTCLALTQGADYFTHGLALFSVTDFRLYDSHYTERYMGRPADNPEGYTNGSAMTYADRYKGMLRIVHGTMDDNVHMQNSIQLADKLESLGKHFEFMLYPGGRHGWGGPKATHLRNENYRFYYKYLLRKEFPEELFGR